MKTRNNNWWIPVFKKGYIQTFLAAIPKEKTLQEVKFIIDVMKLSKKDSILDIPCGNGRHCIEFARAGLTVTGVDYSNDLLSYGKEVAKKDNLPIRFFKGDIRTFREKHKYSTVVILGNSFGYFSNKDNKKVLSNLSKQIKLKGKILLDLPNTPGMLRDIITQSKIKFNNGDIITSSTKFDPKTFYLSIRWLVNYKKEKKEYTGRIKLYTIPEIENLLNQYGLKIKEIYGDFNKGNYDINSSRTIILAEKV